MSVSFDEHLAFLVKQEMGARAERLGFVDAKALFNGGVDLFDNDYERMRYQQGLENGTAMLRGPSIMITPLMIAALLEEEGR